MREHFVVPPIRRREITRIQRSRVRHCVDTLKALDFGNSLLGVHPVPISNIGVAIVNGANLGVVPRRAPTNLHQQLGHGPHARPPIDATPACPDCDSLPPLC